MSDRRRRRPAVSCSLCRKRKIRCDRELPCNNCLRSRDPVDCVYDALPVQISKPRAHNHTTGIDGSQDQNSQRSRSIDSSFCASTSGTHTSDPLITTLPHATTSASQPSSRAVESLQDRARQLEERLSIATPEPSHSRSLQGPSVETTASGFAGTFHVHDGIPLSETQQIVSRHISHKTRVFGQSHWMNGAPLIRDIIEMIDPYLRQETSIASVEMQRCKSFARVVKTRRAPPWPTIPTTNLPSKDICDALVECYLRTSETVYRVLHIPTFRSEYEAVWAAESRSNSAFLVLLKLVLAIGASVHDSLFSMRSLAITWVYEAQTWLSKPELKSRLGIQLLQTNLLLFFAKGATGIGDETIWISAGALLRTAVCMGLHRDSLKLPKKTLFAAEMHRRLWNTILEVAIQSSLNSGNPPMISLQDFDTEPPHDYNDDQLTAEADAPIPVNELTDASISILLRQTLSSRLAVAKLLNDVRSTGSIDKTLELNTELRRQYKNTNERLRQYDASRRPPAADFEIRTMNLIMNHCSLSLHYPYLGAAFTDTTFADSRRNAVESALNIWCAAFPSSVVATTPRRGKTKSSDDDDLSRSMTCGYGYFGAVTFQAAFVIAIELRAQLQEKQSLGPMPVRQDLLSVLREAKAWCMGCIQAGETGIKGYLLICVLLAQVEGTMQGLTEDELSKMLAETVEGVIEQCLPILERMAGPTDIEDSLTRTNWTSPPDQMDQWDLMDPGFFSEMDNLEPMSWILS